MALPGFLAGRPKLSRKFNRLSETEQGQVIAAYNDGGIKGARRMTRGLLGSMPRGAGKGPGIGNKTPSTIPEWVNAQGTLSRNTQTINNYANRPNEYGAFGGRTVTTDPKTGQATVTTTLGGPMQGLYDKAGEQGALKFGSDAATPWSQDYSGDRQRVEQDYMGRFNRMMEPAFAKEEQDFRQRMSDAGIPEGSDAYNQRYEELRKNQDSQRLNAMSEAVQTGGQEQSRLFNQALSGRQAYTGEQTAEWKSPYSGLTDLANTQRTIAGSYQPWYTNTMEPTDLSTYRGQNINKDIAGGNNAASLEAAGISAGASMYGTDVNAELERERQKQDQANWDAQNGMPPGGSDPVNARAARVATRPGVPVQQQMAGQPRPTLNQFMGRRNLRAGRGGNVRGYYGR